MALVETWIEAVHGHQPGVPDAGTAWLTTQAPESFHRLFPSMVVVAERVRDRERQHAASCGDAGASRRPDRRWRALVGAARDRVPGAERRMLTAAADRITLSCTSLPFVHRAALLHGDSAIFAPYAGSVTSVPMAGTRERRRERPLLLRSARTVIATDGEYAQAVSMLPLVDSARAFLTAVHPSPAQSRFVREWYAGMSAHLLRHSDFGSARAHLNDWRAWFPDDERLGLDEAQLEESLASPRTQAEVASLVETYEAAARAEASGSFAGGDASRADRDMTRRRPRCSYLPCHEERPFGVGTASEHLRSAERLLRRVLARAPQLVEARLRLARITALVGRPDAAIEMLSPGPPGGADRVQQYYWHLFLGASLEAVESAPEALRAYAAAQDLYPRARAANLALAHLALSAGDWAAAADRVHATSVPPSSASIDRVAETDPYTVYGMGRGRDAARLLAALWTAVASGELK